MLAPTIHIHPSIIFADKAGIYQSGAHYVTPILW